jgi:ribosomal protein S10
MFIILSIHSKNLNSLTNFLKFFYKLKINKTFKLKYHTIQSQQNKKFSFFSTLQSPHVNKKSQEQFEYSVHNKRLKIHTSQMTKFLTI